jgi:uncharacterized protein (DUF4415 family)
MGTVRFKRDPSNPPKLSDETKARLDAMRDEDIDFSDIPELDERFLTELDPMTRRPKPTVTMRLDEDVVDWFKRDDPKGYTGRMAAVLTAYVRARKSTSS